MTHSHTMPREIDRAAVGIELQSVRVSEIDALYCGYRLVITECFPADRASLSGRRPTAEGGVAGQVMRRDGLSVRFRMSCARWRPCACARAGRRDRGFDRTRPARSQR
jgi:hypothetical protein